jgi:hypothetical protein
LNLDRGGSPRWWRTSFIRKHEYFFKSQDEILQEFVTITSTAISAVNPTKHLCRHIPNGVNMAKATYKIIRNPHTGSILRNREVFCGRCFENFGDEYTLNMHRTAGGDLESECLLPKSIPLTPQRNFSGAVVWRVTF